MDGIVGGSVDWEWKDVRGSGSKRIIRLDQRESSWPVESRRNSSVRETARFSFAMGEREERNGCGEAGEEQERSRRTGFGERRRGYWLRRKERERESGAGAPWRQMRASFIGSVWLGCSLAVRDYETPKVPGTLTIRLLKDSLPAKVTY